MKFAFIAAEKTNHSIIALCRVHGVSTSGYYQWVGREPSLRARRDAVLSVHVRSVHADSRGTYGAPRVAAQLRRDGFRVGTQRIARLMREQGLRGSRRRKHKNTTLSDHGLPVAPNHLLRQFDVSERDRVWVGDITYVKTWQGFLYVAVLIDLFSRRVVGWAAEEHMRTELTLDALRMATDRRNPPPLLIHHTDQGSQYAANDYLGELKRHQAIPSMSERGDCWDNAVAESFFGTLKSELIYRHVWPTRKAAKTAIAEFIERFYNTQRLHSTLGYVSPAEFESAGHREIALAAQETCPPTRVKVIPDGPRGFSDGHRGGRFWNSGCLRATGAPAAGVRWSCSSSRAAAPGARRSRLEAAAYPRGRETCAGASAGRTSRSHIAVHHSVV